MAENLIDYRSLNSFSLFLQKKLWFTFYAQITALIAGYLIYDFGLASLGLFVYFASSKHIKTKPTHGKN
jgi:hypothetical protein